MRQLRKRDKEELREFMVLPAEAFPYKNDITIYADKMAMEAVAGEVMGVVIESREIANDQRAIFELAWAGAKALKKEHEE